MSRPEEDDVALKLVHTADWHLGRRFPSFAAEDQRKLSRARLEVIDRILGLAEQHAADAVLCAGDLFDEPDPGREWWEPLLEKLRLHPRTGPVFLLPGNHDPLTDASVYHANHPFRRGLPEWVHVVDRDDYECALSPEATLYAAPCRSQAGSKDLALSLPSRAAGDERIRIGLVHGSTFDMKDRQTNFPIAQDAAVQRGLDYLAIGDTHSFRQVPPNAAVPTVYPSAPEPTTFGEADAGYAAVVFVTARRRVVLRKEPVAHWSWHEITCGSLSELRDLRDGIDRSRQVVRLTVDFRATAAEYEEAETILRELAGTEAVHGRIGILQLDRRRLELDTQNIGAAFAALPDVLRTTAARLEEMAQGEQGEIAREALMHLYRTARKAS